MALAQGRKSAGTDLRTGRDWETDEVAVKMPATLERCGY